VAIHKARVEKPRLYNIQLFFSIFTHLQPAKYPLCVLRVLCGFPSQWRKGLESFPTIRWFPIPINPISTAKYFPNKNNCYFYEKMLKYKMLIDMVN